MSIEVLPATADRWEDLVKVFGRRGEDLTWCWCQRFLGSESVKSARSDPEVNNREALYREIRHAAVPPGLIAYVSNYPVGWTRVGPRSTLPGVFGNRALARIFKQNDPGVWWVTCFAVDSQYRRCGIGSALLKAAISFARDYGATSIEGHPVDVEALKAARVSGASVFTGTMAMFLDADFVEIGRTYPSRPVMKLLL